VSAEQVATSANAPPPPSPVNPTSTADVAPNTDVQPLGPDLEHAPLITQPKVGKTRFSDEARNKSETASKHHKSAAKTKKVKHDNAKPAPLTTTETATRQVESAPLGLNGATAAKQKKKKPAPVNNGQKTRLSDEKKTESKKKTNDQATPASSDSNGTGGSTAPSTPPVSSSTDQP
jgi:hypothetical protein